MPYGSPEAALLCGLKLHTPCVYYPPCIYPPLCFIQVLRAMAEHEVFQFHETLTGFKWMGNKAAELIASGHTFLFAYEVEIGFAMGAMSLDKDGVRTLAAFAELAFTLAARGLTVADHLQTLYARYGHHRMVNSYFFCPEPAKMTAVFAHVRALYGNGLPFRLAAGTAPVPDLSPGESLEECTVVHVRDLTTGYDSGTQDGKPTLPVDPSSQMITLTLADRSVCTLRGSGTEPKLKYYVEVVDADEAEAERRLSALSAVVVDALLQPSVHGLQPPS